MGTRGPKKKDAKLDALEGNPSRRKRKLPIATKAGPVEILLKTPPEPPGRLGDQAVALWKKLAPILTQACVLTIADLEAFSVLCDTWEEYLEAKTQADKDPYFVTDKGYIAEHPCVRRMAQARDRLDKLWGRFGLTPQARERVMWTMPTVAEEDDLEAFAATKD